MDRDTRGRSTSASDRDAALRKLIESIQKEDFNGNLAAVAREFKIKGSGTLRDFLRGDKGAGLKIISGVCEYTGRTIEQIVAAGGDLATLADLPMATAPRRVRFGELEDWPDKLAVAQGLLPNLPGRYWEMLASTDVWVDGPVTNAMVAEMAAFLARHASRRPQPRQNARRALCTPGQRCAFSTLRTLRACVVCGYVRSLVWV